MTARAQALAAAALLTGCATVSPPPLAPANLPPVSTLRGLPAPPLALNAGAPDAIALDAALAAFGPADVDRREGRGAILTWRLERCALILVFAADATGRLRAQAAEAGPRRAGAPSASLEECVAAAQARATGAAS